jgi:hypothetical protein
MLKAGKRIDRLRVLIQRLKADSTVTLRDMRAVLTTGQMADYDAGWKNIKAYEKDMLTTPEDLKSYLLLLRRADALTQREGAMVDKGKGSLVLERKAETAYETARERLEELLGADLGLTTWLDRPVDFTAGKEPGLTAEEAPRLITGRSIYKQSDGLAKTTKKEMKLTMLENTLAELTKTGAQKRQEKADEKARKKEMKERLAQMRQRNKR